MKHFFKRSVYVAVLLLVLFQSSYALNQVDLSTGYYPNPTIGRALSNANIYVGEEDLDPVIPANQKQISVLQENGTTVQVAQPIVTSGGGVPQYNGSPVTILVDGSYSIKVTSSTGAQIYYVPQNTDVVQDAIDALNNLAPVDSIAALKAITFTPEDGQVIKVLGYYAKTENRDWSFQWVASSTSSEDGLFVFELGSAPLTGRWLRLYGEYITPEMAGVDATGVLDSTTEFNVAANSGKKLVGTQGATYKIDGAIVVEDDTLIDWEMNGATINGSASTDLDLITLGGSEVETGTLLAAISKGATSLTTDLTGLVNGDVLHIRTTVPWGSVTGFKGELVEVKSQTGTTIELKKLTYDNYAGTTTSIVKFDCPKVKVDRLNIVRDSDLARGLLVTRSKDIEISNNSVTGARYTSLLMELCMGGEVRNNQTTDSWYSGTSTSYGIGNSSSQQLDFINNRITDAKHGVFNGGTYVYRDIKYRGNFVGNKYGLTNMYSFDMHAGGELIEISGNTIYNAIHAACKNVSINNNLIYSTDSQFGGVSFYSNDDSDYIDINNNKIYVDSSTGISVRMATADQTIDRINISNNYIESVSYGIRIVPFSAVDTNVTINSLSIENNKVTATPAAPDGTSAILISDTSGTVLTVNDLNINGGVYIGSQITCQIDITPDYGTVRILNTTMQSPESATVLRMLSSTSGAAAHNLIIKNNFFDNAGASIYVYGDNNVTISDNQFKDLITNRGIRAVSNGDIYLNNNTFENCLGSLNLFAIGKIINTKQGINTTSFNSAVPTSGTYTDGDLINNTPSTVGQPIGWKCTASGTFGSATDATGDTDGSTAVITGMTDTSDFRLGSYVSVSAGFATTGPFEVLQKTSTTVTLDTNSNSVQANVTVVYVDPTFTALANL